MFVGNARFVLSCARAPWCKKVYVAPADDVPKGSKVVLRLDAAKNNQQKAVKWAQEYEI